MLCVHNYSTFPTSCDMVMVDQIIVKYSRDNIIEDGNPVG